MASPQVTAVGIQSSHADTNLDGQPIVQIRRRSNFNIQLSFDEDETVANIRDISDVISTSIGVGVGTNFVLSYDPSANNFVFISPDTVVNSAAGNLSGPEGFDSSVVTALAEDLDNQIDLDAGTWS
tara:strand:+ start:299 stop:676 length:378 start_codon:yes stop_codon:yes gene_type:complete